LAAFRETPTTNSLNCDERVYSCSTPGQFVVERTVKSLVTPGGSRDAAAPQVPGARVGREDACPDGRGRRGATAGEHAHHPRHRHGRDDGPLFPRGAYLFLPATIARSPSVFHATINSAS